jgi:hypothetical protein
MTLLLHPPPLIRQPDHKLSHIAFAVAVVLVLTLAVAVAVAVVCSTLSTQKNYVISTEGGAFAAAVERPPHFVFALAVALAVASALAAPASRYPKASALGLSRHTQQWGL